MVKMCNRPTQNKYFTVLHCNRPPLAGTFRRVQRVQAELGLELGLGGQGVLGRLPDHSSLTLLKNFIDIYPLPPPL